MSEKAANTIVSDKLDRNQLAELVARDIAPGSFVNLGIGQPTLVSNFLKPEQHVTLQLHL